MIEGVFVVEWLRQRIVVGARDVGHAREIGASLLLGDVRSPKINALIVREPEEEERTAFEMLAGSYENVGKCEVLAIPM